MRVDVVGETLDRLGIAAIRNERDAALINADEQTDVVVAASCCGLVDADAAQLAEIHARDSLLHIVKDDALQPCIVLPHEAGCGGDRHVRGERHGERLEQEGEARPLARPGHTDLAHATPRACDVRHARGEKRLMLEEV